MKLLLLTYLSRDSLLLFEMPESRQFLVPVTAGPNSLPGSLIPYGITVLRKIIFTVVLKKTIGLFL
jgi:hypothetical protein